MKTKAQPLREFIDRRGQFAEVDLPEGLVVRQITRRGSKPAHAVILSAAKGIACRNARFFAALKMTMTQRRQTYFFVLSAGVFAGVLGGEALASFEESLGGSVFAAGAGVGGAAGG